MNNKIKKIIINLFFILVGGFLVFNSVQAVTKLMVTQGGTGQSSFEADSILIGNGYGKLSTTTNNIADWDTTAGYVNQDVTNGSSPTFLTPTISGTLWDGVTIATSSEILNLWDLDDLKNVDNTDVANGHILNYQDGWTSTSTLFIDESGKVGIGTTNPDKLLTINSSVQNYTGDGLHLINPTESDGSVRQNTPIINLEAQGYSGGATQKVNWYMYGNAMTNGNPTFKISVLEAGGTLSQIFAVDSVGNFQLPFKFTKYHNYNNRSDGLFLASGGNSDSVNDVNWAPVIRFESDAWDTGTASVKDDSWSIGSFSESGNPVKQVFGFWAGHNTRTPNTEIMRLEWDGTNGKVGIGTTSPSALLTIGATSTEQFLVNDIGVITDGVWNGTVLTNDYVSDDLTVNGYMQDTDIDTFAELQSWVSGYTDNDTTYTSSDFIHDDLTGFVANEHLDWTQNVGTINTGNYIEDVPHTSIVALNNLMPGETVASTTHIWSDAYIDNNITITNLSGTNTGDQDLSGYMENTDIDTFAELQSWAVGYVDNDTTYTSSDFIHDDLTGFVANEHLDWTQNVGTINTGNYIEDVPHTSIVALNNLMPGETVASTTHIWSDAYIDNNITITNLSGTNTGDQDLSGYMENTDIDTFAELQSWAVGYTDNDTTYTNLSEFNDNIGVSADWDSLTDMALTHKSIYVGNSSNNPVATTTISITNNGNVGIGTTTSEAKLSVYGRIDQTGLGYSTFLGYEAGLNDDLTSNRNVFTGYNAGKDNTSGSYNVFSGYQAGNNNSTGNRNTFLGYKAGYVTLGGNSNTFLGTQSGQANTSGEDNLFLGTYSGYFNSTGESNTYVGYKAGYVNSTGTGNIALGNYAGRHETGSDAFYVNNRMRIDTDADKSKSILYGQMATAPEDQILTINAKVGISTITPAVALDVNGMIRTRPASSRTCNAQAEGGIMYDSDVNHFYGCNGSVWVQLDN